MNDLRLLGAEGINLRPLKLIHSDKVTEIPVN